jgi:hypothetical protein
MDLGDPMARNGTKWAATLAATAVSTYALDASAAVAGGALVASGLLESLNHQWMLAVLVASYGLWGVGLRTNLRANWTLLATTGTSTNVLSKAGYDLARRTTSSTRAPRLAAAAGYTGTEVVKEVPYYTASFGAAILSDSISANEALIFLSGANVAAAVYEYGVARLTRAFLRHRRS